MVDGAECLFMFKINRCFLDDIKNAIHSEHYEGFRDVRRWSFTFKGIKNKIIKFVTFLQAVGGVIGA